MIAYASRTGTRRNLDALRAAGWRLLISRTGVWRTEGFAYCLDNGAWTDFQQGRAFDAGAFGRLLRALGANADWVAAPDIVAGGMASLDLSLAWLARCSRACGRVLIPVQDGMTPGDLVGLVGPQVGIFLGGSTDWKLAQMPAWGAFCAAQACWFHVARVNSAKRLHMAEAAGATSIDGSSASRFALTLPLLEGARRQRDLFSPRKELVH